MIVQEAENEIQCLYETYTQEFLVDFAVPPANSTKLPRFCFHKVDLLGKDDINFLKLMSSVASSTSRGILHSSVR